MTKQSSVAIAEESVTEFYKNQSSGTVETENRGSMLEMGSESFKTHLSIDANPIAQQMIERILIVDN